MAFEKIGSAFPGFASPFLQDAYEALLRRRKAINHHGTIELFTDPDDSFERLALCYGFANDPTLEIQISEDNRLSIFVRGNKRKQDGKVLLRLQDLRIGGAGQRIVGLVEDTIAIMRQLEGEEAPAVKEEIEEKWRTACIGFV